MKFQDNLCKTLSIIPDTQWTLNKVKHLYNHTWLQASRSASANSSQRYSLDEGECGAGVRIFPNSISPEVHNTIREESQWLTNEKE